MNEKYVIRYKNNNNDINNNILNKLTRLTVRDLKILGSKYHIKRYSILKKDELINEMLNIEDVNLINNIDEFLINKYERKSEEKITSESIEVVYDKKLLFDKNIKELKDLLDKDKILYNTNLRKDQLINLLLESKTKESVERFEYFSQLPNELQDYIIDKLPKSDLTNLNQVSKSINILINNNNKFMEIFKLKKQVIKKFTYRYFLHNLRIDNYVGLVSNTTKIEKHVRLISEINNNEYLNDDEKSRLRLKVLKVYNNYKIFDVEVGNIFKFNFLTLSIGLPFKIKYDVKNKKSYGVKTVPNFYFGAYKHTFEISNKIIKVENLKRDDVILIDGRGKNKSLDKLLSEGDYTVIENPDGQYDEFFISSILSKYNLNLENDFILFADKYDTYFIDKFKIDKYYKVLNKNLDFTPYSYTDDFGNQRTF